MAGCRSSSKSKCGPKQARCAAKTREGKRCKNNASGRSKFCASHKK